MNIESSSLNKVQENSSPKLNSVQNGDSQTSFADELKNGAERENLHAEEANNTNIENNNSLSENGNKVNNDSAQVDQGYTNSDDSDLGKALDNLNNLVNEFNQSDDKATALIKNDGDFTDNKDMINNDFNIQDNKEFMSQMSSNMNFAGNGQAFSSFMNNKDGHEKNLSGLLGSRAKDLEEEKEILSTMAENMAMANKNSLLNDSRIIHNEDGIMKIDSQSGLLIENVMKYDSIMMNKADVEVFVDLVENKNISIEKLLSEEGGRSLQISKTLADALLKAKESNQPLRINFDNNISIIIKISRDGKLSVDFLPSTQVAENYLKENLPLLKQRFDENNIEYESLNQRERRNPDRENKKKGQNNE